jgi:hypothetical protein
MTNLRLLTGLVAAALASSAFAATAPSAQSGFYVVVPMSPMRALTAAAGIDVSLGQAPMPAGLLGIPYDGFDFKPLLKVSGDPDYTGYGVKWTLLSGALPEGLTLNADGTVSGTPSATGTATFQVRATYKTKNGDNQFEIFVGKIEVALAAGNPPQAIAGQFYSYDLKPLLAVTGDSSYKGAGVTWTVVSSSLPAGLALRADGTISGTPTQGGGGTITARASYRNASGEQTYELMTLAINVTLASAAPPQAIVGQAYSYDLKSLLTVTGDNAYNGSGVTWTALSDNLPAGLSLRADGTIAGTPSAAGNGFLTVRASYRNVNDEQAYEVVTLAINVALAAATPPQAIVGQAYSYDVKNLLTVSGDNAYNGSGVTWTVVADTLPAGLRLNSNGTIGGMPTAAGSGSVTARATYRNVSGQQVYQVVTLNIKVALAAGTPPQAIVGQAYSYDLAARLTVTGDSAYNGSGVTWSAVSSTLPEGLTLRANGTVAGTPTKAGAGAITARATYRGENGEQTYQVVTLDIKVALAAGTPPQAIVGQAYNYDLKPLLTVTGDNAYTGAGVTWTMVSSTLPTGLVLGTDGTIAGTPTAGGSGTLVARATYRGEKGEQTYQVVTLNITVSLGAGSAPEAIVGQAYQYDLKPLLTVSGDNAYNGSGVTWAVVSSSLPNGLTLRSDGVIAGTPTASGTGTLTARATYRNVNGQQSYQVVTLGITVTLASASLPQAIVGQAYAYDLKQHLSVSGDNSYNGSGVTWTTVSGALPSGLSLRSDGAIVGTPTAGGTGSFTARATYRGVNGDQAYQVVSLNITVSLGASTPPQARVGETYTYDLKPYLLVSGDSAYNGSGITWATVANSLPVGLSMNGSGVIAGTPSVATTGSLTARATYRNVSGQQAYSITAQPAWTYAWTPGGWATPAACGSTTSTRSMTCVRTDGATVADAYCTAAKPATTQPATDYSTCTFAWSATGWSTPAACGSTTSTRSVTCLRSDGTTVSDASCAGAKPATTQAATDYSSCSYTWASTGWSVPAACGSTTASRTVYCQRSDGATVADASCNAGTKPAATQAATDYSSCTFSWNATGWSTPAACGSTTATRTVYCQRSDGTTVADASCTGAKPASTTPTTDYSSCTYSWASSGWSVPAACGSTTATRSVWCQRSDGSTVADGSCSGTKPATSTPTTDYSTCTYSNSYGGWGSCSASCGGGTQTRSATCVRSDGSAVSSAYCSTPTTSQSCNTQSCYSYSWSASGWSTPNGCGTVTSTRSVTCLRSDGAAMSDAYCSGTKPATTQSDTNYNSCTYSYSYGSWGSCSVSCGGGTQYRSATCYRSDGAVVDNGYCGAAATAQSCNTQACAPATGTWSAPQYTGMCQSFYTGSPLTGSCSPVGSTNGGFQPGYGNSRCPMGQYPNYTQTCR